MDAQPPSGDWLNSFAAWLVGAAGLGALLAKLLSPVVRGLLVMIGWKTERDHEEIKREIDKRVAPAVAAAVSQQVQLIAEKHKRYDSHIMDIQTRLADAFDAIDINFKQGIEVEITVRATARAEPEL